MIAIGKNIVIKQIEEEIKTSSGILLSQDDVSNFRYKKGKVIKSGTEVHDIKEGDDIYYDTATGYTAMIENEQYTIISQRDVVIVLNRTS